MRFWPDSDITAPVRWFFVPRDRPFLPLENGWLWWDSERDPENEGMVRATGELVLGEDYLTDPTWVSGKDPTHTKWVEGVYRGTPKQWLGEDLPEPLPPPDFPPELYQYLSLDCCNHVPIQERCGDTFFPDNGPATYTLTTPLIPHIDFGLIDLPAGSYVASWLGPPTPCSWGRLVIPVPFDARGVQAVIQVGGEPGKVRVQVLFFDNVLFTIRAIYLPSNRPWNGYDPITLNLAVPGSVSPGWTWPDAITMTSQR